ncbi:MAG: hypothetical protein JW755_11515 [Candidatus Aminicenantes bacterium]|nr:hypothetical protein [Candidatus Aminicenantes bacterium]
MMFSCRSRGFCPSRHSKRREEWGALSVLRRCLSSLRFLRCLTHNPRLAIALDISFFS